MHGERIVKDTQEQAVASWIILSTDWICSK